MKLTDLYEKENTFCIYFDYTGAGRGPEPIAGPFDTSEEAKQYAAENDYKLTGNSDYFIDTCR